MHRNESFYRAALAKRAALAMLLLAGSAAIATPDAQSILAASDAVRNPEKPFGLTMTLVEYRDGRQTDASTLAIYSKAESNGGRFRTLIRYVGPPRDAGKLLLQNGTDLWFYDPASQASIRISPQQRLLGQASNGDVVTVNLAHDYRAELAAEEDVTYHRIEIWIEQGSSHPVKGKFYAESGRLLKTAYYRHFRSELGTQRPTEIVIIDGLTPTWVTVMRYSDFAWRDVPDSWLQRDYLPRFRPE
jgi:outer membrane lipoprotein-sorting protein